MRPTFLFATVATLVACGPTSSTQNVATAGATPEPAPEPVVDGNVWSAGVVPAWRVTGVINDVVALDDKRAIAVGGGKLHLVALDTGAVTTAASFAKGTPTTLVHAGGRVLAYGHEAKQAAAWSIDPASLAVSRIELPEPAVGAGPKGRVAIAASPDGARVITCSEDRWPTVRDARTLAPVATFTGADTCNAPRFVDDGRVVLDRVDSRTGGRVGDIASGKVTTVKPGTAVPLPGPGGRSATVELRKVSIRAGGREVASYTASAFVGPVWLGDGSAVVSSARGTLTVLAATAGAALRTVEIPAAFRRMAPIPGTTRLVFQAGLHRLGVIDAANGAVVTASGTNLGDVVKIAVIDGAVVSAAERVRVWRDASIVASGPLAVAEMIDVDAGQPVLYATLSGVFTLDPRSGAAEAVDDEAASLAADRHGARILYDEGEHVRASRDGGRGASWFERSDDFMVTDLDAATGRVAMTDDDAYYVAWPDEDELFGFHPFDCDAPIDLFIERGRARVVTYDGVTVHLYDADQKKALGGIELTDDNINAVAFIPGSDALVLAGADLYLWDPVKHTLVVWPMPAAHAGIGTKAVAVDPAGTQVAVGFADGAVLWARLEAVRAEATPAGADVATEKPPAALTCKGKKLAKRLVEVRGAGDGDGD